MSDTISSVSSRPQPSMFDSDTFRERASNLFPSVTEINRHAERSADKLNYTQGEKQSVVDRLQKGMESAKATAERLERQIKAGRMQAERQQLNHADELLTTYLVLAAVAGAGGDGKGVGHIARQAESMLSAAPEMISQVRSVLETDTDRSGDELTRALDDLDRLSRRLSSKLRMLAKYASKAEEAGETDPVSEQLRLLATDLDREAGKGGPHSEEEAVSAFMHEAAAISGLTADELGAIMGVAEGGKPPEGKGGPMLFSTDA